MISLENKNKSCNKNKKIKALQLCHEDSLKESNKILQKKTQQY